MKNTIVHGDCLEIMPSIPNGSIDMVLCDLPYGTTGAAWDTPIDLPSLWQQYRRVLKPNGAVVLFGSQPFTTQLITSNLSGFRYEMIWEKSRATGHLACKIKPMKAHENIVVFYDAQPTYFPQMEKGKMHKRGGSTTSTLWSAFNKSDVTESDLYYPRTVLKFQSHAGQLHPTEKPQEILEWLIKTYTAEGDTVLDNTCGSGSTCLAAKNTGRQFIGIEKDLKYFEIASARVA